MNKPNDRKEALDFAMNLLDAQISKIAMEISSMKKALGLSANTIQEKVLQLEEDIQRLEVLKVSIQTLRSNEKATSFFLFQHGWGRPGLENFGTDDKVWSSVEGIAFRPEFQGKKTGEKWSSYNEKAEQEEHFHLVRRF